jgi:hypothetical protein
MMTRQTLIYFCRENMDAPTDEHGNLLSKFELSVAQFLAELSDSDYNTGEITLNDDDPNGVRVCSTDTFAEDRD